MALTEVRYQLLDPEKEPQTGVIFTARLLAPTGYLYAGGEITGEAQEKTGDNGMVSLFLTPMSEIEYVGAVYEITWNDQRRTVSVPSAGPVWLRNILTAEPVGGVQQVPGGVGPPGPIGPVGPPGSPGVGTTALPVVTRPRRIVAYNSGSTTLLRAGQITYDVTDDFDADPTGATDASAAWLAMLTQAGDAAASGWDTTVTATGRFRIDTATRLVRRKNVSMVGRSARLTFNNVAGGLDIGDLVSPAEGGLIQGFDIRGNNVCRQPFAVRWVNQIIVDRIVVSDTGYSSADSQYLRDGSTAVLVQCCQNSILNIRLKNVAHHGWVFDYGAGAITALKTHMIFVGQSGSVDARSLVFRQSVPATVNGSPGPIPEGGTHPPVYDKPTNITFDRGYIEGGNNTQASMVDLGQCNTLTLARMQISAPGRTSPMNLVEVSALASDINLADVYWTGNNALNSGTSTKMVTGAHVAAGASNVRITGSTTLSNMAYLYSLDTGADISVRGAPQLLAPSSVAVGTGAGERRAVKEYSVRANTFATLPVPSADYLWVRGLVGAVAAGGVDDVYVCLRSGGTYSWVKQTPGDTLVTVTHVSGVSVILDSALSTRFALTAVANVALANTVDNIEGRMTLLAIDPGTVARTVTFNTVGTGSFTFTTAVPGPSLTIPANKKALIGWRYSGTTNHLIAFTVDA